MISVIIPNKKGRKIKTSLSNQTFKDFEVIIIHDKELKGQSWAINKGVKKAKGEYLMFLDDDISVEDNLLEELYNAIEGHSIAYCNFSRTGMVNGKHGAIAWDYELLKQCNYISMCSLVRAKDFPGLDESIYRLKDWDVWLTMAENGCTGAWVDKCLFTAYFDIDGISSHSDNGEASNIIKTKHNLC